MNSKKGSGEEKKKAKSHGGEETCGLSQTMMRFLTPAANVFSACLGGTSSEKVDHSSVGFAEEGSL